MARAGAAARQAPARSRCRPGPLAAAASGASGRMAGSTARGSGRGRTLERPPSSGDTVDLDSVRPDTGGNRVRFPPKSREGRPWTREAARLAAGPQFTCRDAQSHGPPPGPGRTYRSARPGSGSWTRSPPSGPRTSCWAPPGRRTGPPTPSAAGPCSADGPPCRPETQRRSQGATRRAPRRHRGPHGLGRGPHGPGRGRHGRGCVLPGQGDGGASRGAVGSGRLGGGRRLGDTREKLLPVPQRAGRGLTGQWEQHCTWTRRRGERKKRCRAHTAPRPPPAPRSAAEFRSAGLRRVQTGERP